MCKSKKIKFGRWLFHVRTINCRDAIHNKVHAKKNLLKPNDAH